MLEDALRAIAEAGASGSTVVSANMYEKEGRRPHLREEFGIAASAGSILAFDKKDARVILTIIPDNGHLEKIKAALADLYASQAGKKSRGYTITVVPLELVVGLQALDPDEIDQESR